METIAIILGLVSLIGTIVGAATNSANNQFIDETNEENREFQQETNLQNHQWALEAAQWEYDHNKPQTQYADLLAAGITPAAAAQKVSGASVSYSPATAVAPQNIPKSTNLFNDSLQQVISEIGDYSSMAQAQASAEKTLAETHVISKTGVNKAIAEIDKILADTEVSYSQMNVLDSQVEVNNANIESINANIESTSANTALTNEKINTEKQTQESIRLSNEERKIQLDFTRKTLEMSVQKTDAEIKLLSEQTSRLQEEINGVEFDNVYKQWVNTYIDTYGVAPEQGWQDMLFKAIAEGKAQPILDSFAESLRQVYDQNSFSAKFSQYNDNWKRRRSKRQNNPYPQYSPIGVDLKLR